MNGFGKKLVKKIEDITGKSYNYLLFNRYEYDDKIDWHRDDTHGWVDKASLFIMALYYENDQHFRNLKARFEDSKAKFGISIKHGEGAELKYPTNDTIKHAYMHNNDVVTRESISARQLTPKYNSTKLQDPMRNFPARIKHINQIETSRKAQLVDDNGDTTEIFLETEMDFTDLKVKKEIKTYKECHEDYEVYKLGNHRQTHLHKKILGHGPNMNRIRAL